MSKGKLITDDMEIKEILMNSKKIAVLGISSKEDRDSYKVGQYLMDNNYDIIPVRPGNEEILGMKTVPDLDSINEKIDILDIFRKSDQVTNHVEEALRLKPDVVWMQLGVENQEAADKLTENGINVIMNRCIKIEHNRLWS
ncbi:MAG: CoA-binding protein [Thermodesulfobacteriota bacterium]